MRSKFYVKLYEVEPIKLNKTLRRTWKQTSDLQQSQRLYFNASRWQILPTLRLMQVALKGLCHGSPVHFV